MHFAEMPVPVQSVYRRLIGRASVVAVVASAAAHVMILPGRHFFFFSLLGVFVVQHNDGSRGSLNILYTYCTYKALVGCFWRVGSFRTSRYSKIGLFIVFGRLVPFERREIRKSDFYLFIYLFLSSTRLSTIENGTYGSEALY